jgi:hypothetical protein
MAGTDYGQGLHGVGREHLVGMVERGGERLPMP